MENDGANFNMIITPDTVICNSQLSFFHLRSKNVPTGKAWDEDEDNNIEPAVRPPLSPRKLKSKPGQRRQMTVNSRASFLLQLSLPPERNERLRMYSNWVLSYATYSRIDDGKGGL